jgi:hypothetical protein
MPRPVPAALALPFVVLLARGALAAPPPAAAPAPSPAPSPAPAADDVMTIGARTFDESIAWVARGGALGRARDVYVDVFAVLDVPEQEHFEGRELVWFASPDKMRQERQAGGAVTTKILDGERAWEVLASGSVARLHGRPDAEHDLRQLKEDLTRMSDLAAFLTLEGIKGEGVVFEFQGAVEGSSGATAGKWLKVARRSPDGRKITFWFAYEADANGRPRATWPGVVRVDGDAARGVFTEEWVLKEWDAADAKPRPFRYPKKVQGWRYPEGDRAKAARFALFNLDDVQINAGIDAGRFAPPDAGGAREPK